MARDLKSDELELREKPGREMMEPWATQFEYTLALIINQTRNTQRSEAKGETRDNEVMIYDLVGDYNMNWHEDVSPRREHEVTTT